MQIFALKKVEISSKENKIQIKVQFFKLLLAMKLIIQRQSLQFIGNKKMQIKTTLSCFLIDGNKILSC